VTPRDSYHGQPVIKAPVWSSEIPCYFFTGGLAGASAGLAYLAGVRGNEMLARRAWGMAMLGIGASPPLLIADLGRPMRFISMLRMFKVTSPMSMGSWILTASGATTTLAAVNAWTGLFPRTARLARPAAAAFGLPLSTYTAALIADTAVPVWHRGHRLLPFVYGSGAALSAGGAAVAVTPPADAAPARRLAIGAALIEVGAKELMHRRLGEHAKPYKQGSAALFGRVSRACNLGGAAVLYRWGARSRPAAIAAGALLCAGALSARLSTFNAGYQSAADPKYVVGPQRAGIDRGERPGAARREARVSEPDPALGSPATAPVPAELFAS
jgi:Polysulphide reductase, NrfD